jgi:hydrogenase maturation protein HypF
MPADRTAIRRRLRVTGLVQGVGFRPFVWQRAVGLGLVGWVRNNVSGVTLEVQGRPCDIAQFCEGFAAAAPPLARIDAVDGLEAPVEASEQFVILPSDHRQAAAAWVGADLAPCADCLREMADPRDRRRAYPFINCTRCGPRYTIVEALPYDRVQTTMRQFAMCPQCLAEYANPADRRFHAQPNACAACGPRLWLASPQGVGWTEPLREATAALAEARRMLAAGQVLGVKGVGGFHLVCDATRHDAVTLLRQRKRRWAKPLAVMAASLDACRRFALVEPGEQRLLESQERPIVLLRKAPGDATLAAAVAPDNPYVGVMLPDAPLHALLAEEGPPLVFTSGNLSEEPIVTDNDAAVRRLGPLVDGFLLHDRGIHVPCDDSVIRSLQGQVLPIRRSRGYAPLPVRLPAAGPSVLAVGGELKATCCVTRGAFAFLSQHIGDMENLETLEAMQRAAEHLQRLFRAEPACVAADLHPDYLSTQWAREAAQARGLPLKQFQHHVAHVAALRAEYGLAEGEGLIGVCFDGTGWGSDGAIWGGEAFVSTGVACRRAARLRYLPLPGGDACAARPYRTALAGLWAAGVPWDARLPCVAACPPEERAVLARQLEGDLQCLPTSSMGRLFDAAASLIGLRHHVRYEAEAALELEHWAVRAEERPCPDYRFACEPGEPLVLDSRPVLAAIARDVLAGVDCGSVAAGFHRAVVAMIVDVALRLHAATGWTRVGLTGGVFQNAWLVQRADQALRAVDLEPLVHRLVPPNDGGLALGQAWLAVGGGAG